MNKLTLFQILDEYIVHEEVDGERVVSWTDEAGNELILEWGNNEEQYTFALDVPVTVDGKIITAVDLEGEEHTFVAYTSVDINKVEEGS